MYSMAGSYPESPAESEESITDESNDADGGFSSVSSPYGSVGRSNGGARNAPSRRESTAQKQRKWAVRTFSLFLETEGITKSIEEMRPHELNQHLKKFYKQAKRKDGCDFSKPGLTNIRNALDRYIKSICNFTILKTSEFEEANQAFDEKIGLIEGNAASPWRNSVSINPQDMQRILASGVIGGGTPLQLLRACWFNVLLHFDVGDHLKQRRLSKQQLVIHCDSSGQEHVKMVNFPFDQGKYGMVGNVSSANTMHSVPGHPLCPVALLKKYLSKLHPESDALFQCPVQYKVDDSVPVWYEKQAVGVHALEGMMTCLSKEAGLSRVYSNGCLRKSSSLVYLQCGFGFDPRNITSEPQSPLTPNSAIASSSGMPSFGQSVQERLPQLPSPSGVGSRSSSTGDPSSPFHFPVDNKQPYPVYPSPSSNQPYPQANNSVNMPKPDAYQNAKRSQQSYVPSDTITSQHRTAIGVCMPTIKMEDGGVSVCEGSSMGVQPTFPTSESIDFPSVTETISPKREMSRNQGQPSCQSTIRTPGPSSLPSDLQRKTYLHMEVLGGKSFIEFEHYQPDPGQQTPTVTLHTLFRGQRFKSHPTSCCVNPNLKQDFYLELHDSPSPDNGTLLNITDPISLVLSKTEVNQSVSLIGSHNINWQKILREANGALVVTIDINGMGEESKMMIGSLQMRFQVLTNGQRQVIQPQVVDTHISNIQSRISERERRFMGYARQWWKDYMSGCPSHSRKQVKIFAQNECSTSKPVVAFITPINACRLFESPRHAARFVSLLKHEEECSMFGNKVDSWSSVHAFLCRGKGSCEDHAILLCSVLLGFGLDASVCLGTKDTGQPHSWVMSRHPGGKIVFWESLTGQRYAFTKSPSAVCPQYRTLGCIFNNKSFYANIQASGMISTCDFDVTNTSKWKGMDPTAIHAVCGDDIQPALPISPCLSPPTINPVNVSMKLEQELKTAIEDYRRGIGFTVQWDNNLPHILSPCLAANENEAKTGQVFDQEELREPVYQYLSGKMSFHCISTCVNHYQVTQAIADIQSLQEFHAVIDCNEEHVHFALRVQIYPYPEDSCATWIMLAARYPSKDSEPSYKWQTVSLPNQMH